MKNRICIFSFYDSEGHADEYIRVLLREMMPCIRRLVVVVNGNISGISMVLFREFTEEIYIRENKGYDAGAFKHGLVSILGTDELKEYEEVILCNDTFFGPFKPFAEIFGDMEEKDCDFWGLNGFFGTVFAHIQSYFLVFRKSILQECLLTDYFDRFIDASTEALNDVYCQFETGLFDFLFRVHQKKYAMYALPCNYDVYRYSFTYIKDYRLPIVKKKTFSNCDEDWENIWCTLSYIKNNTAYDVSLILSCIRRIYGLDIKEKDIRGMEEYPCPKAVEVPTPVNNDGEIERFIAGNEFYIYGTGMYACKTYWRFARDNHLFMGFIVSDNKRGPEKTLYGKPVYEFSEIADIYNKKIVLGVGDVFAEEIIGRFHKTDNVLRIF